MPGESKITKVVGVRLLNEDIETLRRRCRENRFDSISAYLRDLIHYQINRSHHRRDIMKQRDSETLKEDTQSLSPPSLP